MDGDAILGAVRAVITGTLGSVRTVPSGTFGEDVHGDTGDTALWVRSKVKAQADVRMSPPRRTRAVGPSSGSRAVLEADFDVRLTYAADSTEDLIPARRYAVRALAAENALAVTQALTWPGNVGEYWSESDAWAEDFTTWTAIAATVTGGVADPVGGTAAATLDDSSGAEAQVYTAGPTLLDGVEAVVDFWIAKDSDTSRFPLLELADGLTAKVRRWLNTATGAVSAYGADPWAVGSVEAVEAVTGWWRVRFTVTPDADTVTTARIHPAKSSDGATPLGSVTGSVVAYRPAVVSSAATALVSSKLRERAAAAVTREDWSAGIYEIELRLAGWILESQAIA